MVFDRIPLPSTEANYHGLGALMPASLSNPGGCEVSKVLWRC